MRRRRSRVTDELVTRDEAFRMGSRLFSEGVIFGQMMMAFENSELRGAIAADAMSRGMPRDVVEEVERHALDAARNEIADGRAWNAGRCSMKSDLH